MDLLTVGWLVAAFLAGLIAKDYLPGYLRKKAENLATKQDIAGITDEIERVRHDYASSLELLKVELLRQQRGTDRMLDWCEQVCGELLDYVGDFRVILGIYRDGSPKSDADPWKAKIIERSGQIPGLTARAMLYLPADVVSMIDDLRYEFLEFGESMEYFVDEGGTRGAVMTSTRLEAHLQRVQAVAVAIAQHHREQVGRDALPRGDSRGAKPG